MNTRLKIAVRCMLLVALFVVAAASVFAEVQQTTCPVMEGTPVDKSIFADYKGKRVYFCCQLCKTTFEESPEKFLSKLPQFMDVDANKSSEIAVADEHSGKTDHPASCGAGTFSFVLLVRPFGLATFLSLLVTVVLGMFRRKLARKFLFWHRIFAIMTLVLAILHVTIIQMVH